MSKKQGATGSPNVFKDLGVPRPEEHLVKAQLMFKIDGIMKSLALNRLRPPSCSVSKRPVFRRC